ncbi:MAG: hypothetical protein AB7O62_21655 [Pirellulales bacterium]
MNQNPSESERIALEMQQVRADMHHEVQHLVAHAKTLTDWRHYVKSHPWICVGAAAAVGFLAVPSRKKVIQLDASGVRELGQNQQLVVRVAGNSQPARPSLLGVVAGMAARAAMNGGLALLSQQLSQMTGGHTPQRAKETA